MLVKIIEFLANDNVLYFLAASAVMTLDVVTGVMKAAYTRNFSSEKMRVGFWHKSANFILLIMSYSVSAATTYIYILPDWAGGIYLFTAVYLVVMETSSILENLAEINPALKNSPLIRRFKDIAEGEKNVNDE